MSLTIGSNQFRGHFDYIIRIFAVLPEPANKELGNWAKSTLILNQFELRNEDLNNRGVYQYTDKTYTIDFVRFTDQSKGYGASIQLAYLSRRGIWSMFDISNGAEISYLVEIYGRLAKQ